MQLVSIVALALLGLQSPPAPAPGTGEFAALKREYESALAEHRAELERLKGSARSERAKEKPAAEFWERFQGLAEAGEGRAVFWMASHARERGGSLAEGRAEAKRLYGELAEGWADAEWFGQVVDQLGSEREHIGSEEVERICRLVLEKNPARKVQAEALAALVSELSRKKTPEAEREAAELRARLAADYADTEKGARTARKLGLAVGAQAPDFTGRTIEGQEFKLSDYRGKVVLVDFYGFWCGPCRASIPHLRELVKVHGEKPFAIIGVNTGDAPDVYKRGLEEHGITWTSAYQGPRAAIAELYDVQLYPTLVLIDREGVIVAKGHSAEDVTGEIERLLPP